MGVKTTFPNETIDEEVYIEQPKWFEVNNKDTHVYGLKKALYGLKQAPTAWYARVDVYLLKSEFMKSSTDPNLFIKVVENEPFIILLYLDDLFIKDVEQRLQEWKKMLVVEFEMKDLGLMHYYLGLEVWKNPSEIYFGQGKYIIKFLKKIGMMDSKPMNTPIITNLKNLRRFDSSIMDPTSLF